jgi:hypothetical protein
VSDPIRKASRFSPRGFVLGAIVLGLGGSACAQILGLGDYKDCCEPIGIGKVPECVYCDGTTSSGMTGSGSGGGECKSSADCSTDTTCVSASCDASHQCLSTNADLGQACDDHNGKVCDGAGVCVECNELADCMATTTACKTATACTAHACTFTDAPVANACTDSGGNACDGKGQCIGAVSVVAGSYHTCAVTTLGGAKCWGSNNDGQLGDGTTTNALKPVDVSGLTSGVAAIAAGRNHSCALTKQGGVKCWGSNENGQLGNGTNTDSGTPVDVSTLSSGVTAIACGDYSSCAVTTGGAAKCWGMGSFGQLGNGSSADSNVPVDVTGLTSGVTGISVGTQHACALTTGAFSGIVKCWGDNSDGQLGDGTKTSRNVPGPTSSGAQAAAISAGGFHTCALLTSSDVNCWGDNGSGQLGDGTTTQRISPTAIPGLTEVAAIECGEDHTCALDASGAKCWGFNVSGQLGDGTTTDRHTPTTVTGSASAVGPISAGSAQSCVIGAKATLECWGGNDAGEVGDGTMLQRTAPVSVFGL